MKYYLAAFVKVMKVVLITVVLFGSCIVMTLLGIHFFGGNGAGAGFCSWAVIILIAGGTYVEGRDMKRRARL